MKVISPVVEGAFINLVEELEDPKEFSDDLSIIGKAIGYSEIELAETFPDIFVKEDDSEEDSDDEDDEDEVKEEEDDE